MVAYRLTLDLPSAAVAKLGRDVAHKEVATVTRRVFNRATVLTPVDTGLLRASNRMRVRRTSGGAEGEVWNDVEYGPAVHSGHGPVVIRPKRAKALRFIVDGRVVFARRVTLPARRGRPWLLRALKEVAAQRGYRITT